jgi:DNA-binding NtrC family response regulator
MLEVLFVDDEPLVLEALRALLRGRRREWNMRFVRGGKDALDELALQPVDAVVSDLRMPDMDGYALLDEVSRRAADAIRIILSGDVGDMPADMVDVVHAVLSKPCDHGALEDAINLAPRLGLPSLGSPPSPSGPLLAWVLCDALTGSIGWRAARCASGLRS